MNDPEKMVRRIKRRQRWFTLLLIAVTVGGALLPLPIYVKLPLLLLAVLMLLIGNGVQLNRRMASILLDERDPLKYHYVVHRTGLAGKDAAVDISTACAVGDHISAVQLCNRSLEMLKKTEKRIPYLLILCHCFFELGDTESLRRVLDELTAYTRDRKRGAARRKFFGYVLDYYESYCRADYEACKRAVEAMPARKNKYSEMRSLLLYGLACYGAEQRDEAAKALATVAETCPLLHIGRIARDQLGRIASGEAMDIRATPPVPPGSVFPVLPPERVRKNGYIRWVVVLVAVCVLILSLDAGLYGMTGTPMEVLADGERVTEIYGVIPVNGEGDALCLYEAAYDTFFLEAMSEDTQESERYLSVAYLNCVGENTYRYGTSVNIDVISPAATYSIRAGDANLVMHFQVVEKLTDVPEGAAVTVFWHNDEMHYFCLTAVEEKRCVGYGYSFAYAADPVAK